MKSHVEYSMKFQVHFISRIKLYPPTKQLKNTNSYLNKMIDSGNIPLKASSGLDYLKGVEAERLASERSREMIDLNCFSARKETHSCSS